MAMVLCHREASSVFPKAKKAKPVQKANKPRQDFRSSERKLLYSRTYHAAILEAQRGGHDSDRCKDGLTQRQTNP